MNFKYFILLLLLLLILIFLILINTNFKETFVCIEPELIENNGICSSNIFINTSDNFDDAQKKM